MPFDCWTSSTLTSQTQRRIVVVGIPKNAGTSVIRSLGLTRTRFEVGFLRNAEVIAVVRDPMTRILSAYNQVLRVWLNRSETLEKCFYQLRERPQESFDSFLTEIDPRKPYDQHIQRQRDIIDEIGAVNVTQWWTFERLADHFRDFVNEHFDESNRPILMHRNATNPDEQRRLDQITVNRPLVHSLYSVDTHLHSLLTTSRFAPIGHDVYVARQRIRGRGLDVLREWIDQWRSRQKSSGSAYRYLSFVDDADMAQSLFYSYFDQLPFLDGFSHRMPISRYEVRAPESGIHRERCSEPWQAIIYINDDYDGGELSFYSDSTQLLMTHKPRSGDIVLFPTTLRHNAHAITDSRENKYIAVLRLTDDHSTST